MTPRQAYALLHPIKGAVTFEAASAYAFRIDRRYDTFLMVRRDQNGRAIWQARVMILSSAMWSVPMNAWGERRKREAEGIARTLLRGVGEGTPELRETETALYAEVPLSGAELVATDPTWRRPGEERAT